MQQQPLAFTLVKTVVSARDEGKVLSPALATAWDLLRAELSPAHRVIAAEVKWSPAHQEDLRFVIEGIRKQFEKDPDLEGEFLAFLAEVEPFGESEKKSSILPMVIGITSGSSIPSPKGTVEFAFENQDSSVHATQGLEVEQPPSDLSQDAEFVKETPAQSTLETDEISVETNAEPLFSEASPIEDGLTPSPTEAASEGSPATELVAEVEKSVENLSLRQAQGGLSKPEDSQPIINAASASVLKYWPFVAAVFLIAAIGLGTWFFSDSPEIQPTVQPATEISLTTDTIAENVIEEILPEKPALEYSARNIARMSEKIDSLLLVGDYVSALTQQQVLTNRLETDDSPPQEIAQAYSELAILYATQQNILQAIVEQRKSLEFARKAFATTPQKEAKKTDPSLGRSHLKLASFYTEIGELHMARAHLQQARHLFGEVQELISPTDLKATNQVAEKILKAS